MNLFRIPPVPPVIFTVSAGAIHATLWTFEPLTTPWNLISGSIIIAIAAVIFISSLLAFRQHNESFDIRKPTNKLVTDGIYASSRNPAYLAFIIAILGIGCAVNSLAIILATIPSFAILNWYNIPREERYLRQNIGYKYQEYTKRVRRWL